MAGISVEDLKRHYSVEDHQLQLQCLEAHFEILAHRVSNWLSIAIALGLNEYQQQAIRVDSNLDYLHKNLEVLKVWKKNEGPKATYLRLVQACLEISNAVLAGEVCELAKAAIADSNPHSLESWFRGIGLTESDIKTLVRQGFSTRQAFNLLTKSELNNLGLTQGGLRILQKHFNEQQSNSEVSSSHSHSSSSNVHTSIPVPRMEYLSPNPHLRYVYKHTYAANTKWFNIGLQLGLPKHTLDSIGRNRTYHDDGDYYREMLTSWMHEGQAKMEELLEALGGPTVGFEDVVRHVNSLKSEERAQMGLSDHI